MNIDRACVDGFSVCSFNMHGFKQGERFLKINLNKYDICCIQEHWLYPSTASEFCSINCDYECKVVCEMRDDELVGPGRPKGGLAILWKKALRHVVKYVGSSLNNRVMTMVIECNDFNICLCNVYLPCFGQNMDYGLELMECLSYIDYVYEQVKSEYCNIELCIIGDFNVTVNKLFNCYYTGCFKEFIMENNLCMLTESLEVGGGYTYSNQGMKIYSMLDHCAVSEGLKVLLNETKIVEDVDNFSDHLPIVVRFNTVLRHCVQRASDVVVKVKWDTVSCKRYHDLTRDGLYGLHYKSCDIAGLCCDSGHNVLIDKYCEEIINVLYDATVWEKKVYHVNKRNFVWTKDVNAAKQHALQKYKAWLLSGKLKDGDAYDDMVKTKKEYKREIKKVKNMDRLKRNAYVENLLYANDNTFWRSWRRCRNGKSLNVSDIGMSRKLLDNFCKKYVDSMDNVLLFQEFMTKYGKMTQGNNVDMNVILDDFSVEEIECCVGQLHLGRSRDRNELTVEHIINAHPIVYSHLKNLFCLIVKHGHVPSDFKMGAIVPVVKDRRKDINNVDNYRPVTIVSVISKVFEMCLYKRINCCLNVKGMQYGFVKEGGCEKCIYSVQNVVNYYLKRKSDVYIVALDASAAFDRVNVYGLMSKLIDRNVPVEIMRVLFSWFNVTHACVRLGNVYSDYVDIKSGIKQGGIMSPIFYNIYVDDLMDTLMKGKLGCTIGDYFYGAIFYADDILLLGGSVRKMQKMLDICCDYGNMYGITFNPTKSKWFCTDLFGSSSNVFFELNGYAVQHEVESILYLGVKFIMKRGCLVVDVNDRIKKFNGAAYDVLLNSHDLSEVVRCEIIVKKCLPVLLYGIGCVELFHDDRYKLFVAYRKAFRYIFHLSLKAHISELLEVFGVKSLYILLDEKFACTQKRNLMCRFAEIRFLTLCNMLE
jgi:hypothetical protein